jgi:hypothetical protein
MCSQVSTYYEIAKFITKMWKYNGLPVYSLEVVGVYTTKKFVYKTSHQFFLRILLIIILTLYMKYVGVRRDLDSFIIFVQFLSIYVQSAAIVEIFYMKRHAMATLFTKLLLCENELFKLYKTTTTKNTVKSTFFTYTFIQALMVTTTMIFDCQYITNNFKDSLFIVIQYIGIIFNLNLEILLIFILSSIRDLYSKLITITGKEQTNLKKIHETFRHLHDLCNNVINTLQELLLLKTLTDFILSSSGLFYGCYSSALSETDSVKFVLQLLFNFLWQIIFLFSNFFMCYSFDKIMEYVSKSDVVRHSTNNLLLKESVLINRIEENSKCSAIYKNVSQIITLK